jgi:hypothetical protein
MYFAGFVPVDFARPSDIEVHWNQISGEIEP